MRCCSKPYKKTSLTCGILGAIYNLFLIAPLAASEYDSVDDALEDVNHLVVLLRFCECSNRTSCRQNRQCNLGPVLSNKFVHVIVLLRPSNTVDRDVSCAR